MRKKPEYVSNGLINVPNITVEYRGYKIVPKRDFGNQPYLVNGCVYKKGYVITDLVCNIMPGATWSHSVIEAKAMIDTLHESIETGKDFWELHRVKQGLMEWEEV
jgi:hypothetical protein